MIAYRYSRGAMNIAATFIIPFMSLNALESGASKNPKSTTFVLQWIVPSFFGVVVPASNQLMKPTAPLRCNFSVFATTPCRGLSPSR